MTHKPRSDAASALSAVPPNAQRPRMCLLHAGRSAAIRNAWVDAAERVGFDAREWDTREIAPAPDADVLLPMDLSYVTRCVLTERYSEDWTNAFIAAPELCADPLLFLSRRGFPTRRSVACASGDAATLHHAVEQLGGFPVEAWIGAWITANDMENFARLVQRAHDLHVEPLARAPLSPSCARWLAVAFTQCVGPACSTEIRELAVRAVHALRARTGVVEYEVDASGAVALISVNAPGDLAQLPMEWWSSYCLAVVQGYREASTVLRDQRSIYAPVAQPTRQLLAEPV